MRDFLFVPIAAGIACGIVLDGRRTLAPVAPGSLGMWSSSPVGADVAAGRSG